MSSRRYNNRSKHPVSDSKKKMSSQVRRKQTRYESRERLFKDEIESFNEEGFRYVGYLEGMPFKSPDNESLCYIADIEGMSFKSQYSKCVKNGYCGTHYEFYYNIWEPEED
jgi:hypothetical protein